MNIIINYIFPTNNSIIITKNMSKNIYINYLLYAWYLAINNMIPQNEFFTTYIIAKKNGVTLNDIGSSIYLYYLVSLLSKNNYKIAIIYMTKLLRYDNTTNELYNIIGLMNDHKTIINDPIIINEGVINEEIIWKGLQKLYDYIGSHNCNNIINTIKMHLSEKNMDIYSMEIYNRVLYLKTNMKPLFEHNNIITYDIEKYDQMNIEEKCRYYEILVTHTTEIIDRIRFFLCDYFSLRESIIELDMVMSKIKLNGIII